MHVALYGRQQTPSSLEQVRKVIRFLDDRKCDISMFSDLAAALEWEKANKIFHSHEDLGAADLMISLGGDVTLLNTLTVICDREIPVLGINTGRLGFLANVSVNRLEDALNAMLNGELKEEKRMLIQAHSDDLDFDGFSVALNEVTLHKKDSSSMVSVHVEVDGTFMNNYWADGLIICTPTGSTAYSLSCGGPIVAPGSDNLSITPIAPHNLNVRPMVISSSSKIRIKAAGREDQFFLTLDSRSYTVSSGTEITLEKAPFAMRLLGFKDQDFFSTIRNKMLWGIDKRN